MLGAEYPVVTGTHEGSWKDFEISAEGRKSWEAASLFNLRRRLENVVHHSFDVHSGCTAGCKGEAKGFKDEEYLDKSEHGDAFDELMGIVRHRGELGKLHKVPFRFVLPRLVASLAFSVSFWSFRFVFCCS